MQQMDKICWALNIPNNNNNMLHASMRRVPVHTFASFFTNSRSLNMSSSAAVTIIKSFFFYIMYNRKRPNTVILSLHGFEKKKECGIFFLFL